MAGAVAEGGHRGGVAGEVEIQCAVGQVSLRAGQACGRGEFLLGARILERGSDRAVVEQIVEEVVGIGVVDEPSALRPVEWFARSGQVPLATLTATALILVLATSQGLENHQDVMNLVYLAWLIPTRGYVSLSLFGRRIRIPRFDQPAVALGA